MRRSGNSCARRAPLYGASLVALAVLWGCSAPRLQPADAQRLIQSHPRFREPQTLRVPAKYCADAPGSTPPPLPPTDPAYTPPQDVNHMQALQDARVITVAHRPAAAECSGAKRELFTVTLTSAGAAFHPTSLSNGWEFVLAERKFVSIENITYDDPDSPRIVHVQYVWQWVPTLLGQLVQIGGPPQGASATFLRDGNGWIVRQPGM